LDRAPYACNPAKSRGRRHGEPSDRMRSEFQRDRDRIIHSTAFRRLKHKTQVFILHEGDHFRTRLTHSIEVAQIARTLARALRLDEDLAEALALAHDLGHPPFGHAGERALQAAMAPYGGFDHNAQALRIVTSLEQRYALFDGLNLTWETLEGLVKHNGPLLAPGAGAETLADAIRRYPGAADLRLDTRASLEAQVAAIADDIAYDTHDIDDGVRAGLLSAADLAELPLTREAFGEVERLYGAISFPRGLHETLRRVMSRMIRDVLAETQRRVALLAPEDADAVRYAPTALAGFSPEMAGQEAALKRGLFERVYRHPSNVALTDNAERVVHDLFATYMRDPAMLPDGHGLGIELRDEAERARGLCDFIAGMTDRYALGEHARLFDDTPRLR
jgi:dGTPase